MIKFCFIISKHKTLQRGSVKLICFIWRISMKQDPKNIEDILIEGLTHILRRTLKVNNGDQLAIAQEYREWINCISASDFSDQEILIIRKSLLN